MILRRALRAALLVACGCSGREPAADASSNTAGSSGGGMPSGAGTSGRGGAAPSVAGSAGAARGGDASGGGASSGAEHAGTGGVQTPPLGKCENLPTAGVWEDVTPHGTSTKPAVNGTVGAAILVDPFDPRTVWLGTGGREVIARASPIVATVGVEVGF